MTQGDPLAIITYDIGILQIIHELRDVNPQFKQPWYADDTGAGGHLAALRAILEDLMVCPPLHGKFPDPTKSILVILKKDLLQEEEYFKGMEIRVVTGNH